MPNTISLFAADDTAKSYRIPSIIKTKNNVLIAACDARKFSASDYPNRVDKVIKRSLDDGETWSEIICVKQAQGVDLSAYSEDIDPSLLYDEEKNIVYMLYTHTPFGVYILNAKRSSGILNGGILLTKDKQKYSYKNGAIYTKDDADTGYSVDKDGFVYKDGENYGNIYSHTAPFKEYPTFYLYLTKSEDEGLTWSEPVCLNSQIKSDEFAFIGAGPGIGIRLKHGANKGRLLFPIYINYTERPPLAMNCALIYSDDDGKTWTLGEFPIQARKCCGLPVPKRYHIEPMNTTEAQVIELKDGTVKIFMRNHSLKKCVATAVSRDGGVSWENFRFNKQLIQPICQLSVISMKDEEGKDIVVFLNSASKNKRENGTIRISYDEGETFPYSKLLKSGEFVYSSMTALSDGEIGVLYEPSTEHLAIDYIRVSTKWIKEKKADE